MFGALVRLGGCRAQELFDNQRAFIAALTIHTPLLRLRRRSRGVSRCTLPLRRRLFPGVRAALARSLNALMAWGVVGAALRAEIGRVAGPPRGVLAAVPGVRKVGVLRLPGVGPALIARRNGVIGSVRAVAFGVAATSGDRRCFLRADSAIAAQLYEHDTSRAC